MRWCWKGVLEAKVKYWFRWTLSTIFQILLGLEFSGRCLFLPCFLFFFFLLPLVTKWPRWLWLFFNRNLKCQFLSISGCQTHLKVLLFRLLNFASVSWGEVQEEFVKAPCCVLLGKFRRPSPARQWVWRRTICCKWVLRVFDSVVRGSFALNIWFPGTGVSFLFCSACSSSSWKISFSFGYIYVCSSGSYGGWQRQLDRSSAVGGTGGAELLDVGPGNWILVCSSVLSYLSRPVVSLLELHRNMETGNKIGTVMRNFCDFVQN